MKRTASLVLGLLTLLGAAGPARAQGAPGQVAAFLEDPGAPGFGAVALFDEVTGARLATPVGLRRVRLLGLDFAGRTTLSEMDPACPSLCDDIPGAARIELPAGQGSLYRYERPETDGATFGFLHLAESGDVQTLLETFVPRSDGAVDPFVQRIALSPDGGRFLVATKRHAGGDVFEVDLATGTALNRTRHLPPQLVKYRGLVLGDDLGLAVTRDGVLRFRKHEKSIARFVAFPSPAPTYFAGDVVLSQNTRHALLIAGDSPAAAHAWAFDAGSAAVQVSLAPARMSRGGFLPEYRNGPYMAISDDGALAAWRQEMTELSGIPTSELFLASVPALMPQPAEQITSDARYLDTLDEVGQIFFLDPRTIAYAVGEKEIGPDGIGMTGADLFTARMPAGPGAPQILNLSQTNGQVGPPFTLPPNMKPKAIAWMASEQRFVVFDDDTETLVTFDATLGGAQTMLANVKDVGLFEVTPNGFLIDARRTFGGWDLMRHTGALSTAPVLVQSSPNGNENARPVRRPDGTVSFVGTPGATERLSRVNVATGLNETMTSFAQYGPAIGYSPAGSVLFSAPLGAASTRFALWQPAGTVLNLAAPNGSRGFVLPAR